MSTHTNAQTTGGLTPRVSMQEAVDAVNHRIVLRMDDGKLVMIASGLDPDWTPNVGPEADVARSNGVIPRDPFDGHVMFPMQQMPHQRAALILGELGEAAKHYAECKAEADAAYDAVDAAREVLDAAESRQKTAVHNEEEARSKLLTLACKKAA